MYRNGKQLATFLVFPGSTTTIDNFLLTDPKFNEEYNFSGFELFISKVHNSTSFAFDKIEPVQVFNIARDPELSLPILNQVAEDLLSWDHLQWYARILLYLEEYFIHHEHTPFKDRSWSFAIRNERMWQLISRAIQLRTNSNTKNARAALAALKAGSSLTPSRKRAINHAIDAARKSHGRISRVKSLRSQKYSRSRTIEAAYIDESKKLMEFLDNNNSTINKLISNEE
jgi:hypothetical protein